MIRPEWLPEHPPSAGKAVIIGCGNLLRGDDAVGPTLIRHLWSSATLPDDVVLVDGGTAGLDVAFKMQSARRVVLVDAATTGAAAGTIYEVPGSELEQLPPPQGLHAHQVRWDHALALGRWMLGDAYPPDVTVYLIEVADCTPGAELSPAVRASMHAVAERIRATLGGGRGPTVESGEASRLEPAGERR